MLPIFRRPGQAATEQRSTSNCIVAPVCIVTPAIPIPVGQAARGLPEIGSRQVRALSYELLEAGARIAFSIGSRVDFKATGVASWSSSMPRRSAGHS